MLSKIHYQKIAEILSTHTRLESNDVTPVMDDVVSDIASYFKEDNPNFNKRKFYDAVYGVQKYHDNGGCDLCPNDESICLRNNSCSVTGKVKSC